MFNNINVFPATTLVVDDDQTNILLLSTVLKHSGFHVVSASDGQEALDCVENHAVDLVLLDIVMPKMDGFETCRRLKASAQTADIPVIFMSMLMEASDKVDAFAIGAVDYVTKPLEIKEVLARVVTHLKLKRLQEQLQLGHTVLMHLSEGVMITDEHLRIVDINKAFTAITGYNREEVLGRKTALLKSGYHDHDFYWQMWQQLQTEGTWQGEVWNKHKNGRIFPEFLSINILHDNRQNTDYYIGVFHDISERKRAEAVIIHQANYDLLTDLPNRNLFTDRLNQTIQQAKRQRKRLGLMFIDLDGFKGVNDHLGHDRGDQVLRTVATKLKQSIRASDSAARIGGDEFTVILPETNDFIGLETVAKKILVALKLSIHHHTISASIGIACYPEHGEDMDVLLKNADNAMYLAKQAGGNQFVIHS